MGSRGDHGRGLKPWTTTACGGFAWPPQRSPPLSSCYSCGYCRREFRSAQALGGHMNVHRRDRARLRQCCSASAHPAAASSALPSPSLSAHHHQHRAPLPNLNLSPPPHSAMAADPVIYSFFATTTTASAAASATTKQMQAALEVSLELGIGVCGSGRRSGVVVEDDGLDLELRLGCAWE